MFLVLHAGAITLLAMIMLDLHGRLKDSEKILVPLNRSRIEYVSLV